MCHKKPLPLFYSLVFLIDCDWLIIEIGAGLLLSESRRGVVS